ncbi:hypothetical protein [Radiobacillus sp. PE A8.2]|uniref:hypothetical protein n=1 Tax=Radiobacillus sp. PE A8.2 TaxID=3380349 RepID=UPI00388EF618
MGLSEEAKDILEESFKYIDDGLNRRFEQQNEAFQKQIEPIVDLLEVLINKLLDKE